MKCPNCDTDLHLQLSPTSLAGMQPKMSGYFFCPKCNWSENNETRESPSID